MKIVSNAALALAALPWLAACSSPTSSSPTFKVTFTSNPDPAWRAPRAESSTR